MYNNTVYSTFNKYNTIFNKYYTIYSGVGEGRFTFFFLNLLNRMSFFDLDDARPFFKTYLLLLSVFSNYFNQLVPN